ncbi:MAG: SDR family oxidoreductase [Parasphingorhabdus sp.]|jgi:2-hydroxycyclohexanecarboxyl-CoA dehydrogenase|nr:SDR family oxidoreductase [Parasphingorhabdus sp.]
MNLHLNDRIALVTGGGQGVGRRICHELAAEGAVVAVNDLFAERAEAVADEIVASGGRAIAVPADITDAAAVEAMFDTVASQVGPVTVLVNNAGIIPERREKGGMTPRFVDTPVEDWPKIIGLNVYGTMNCCRAALPGMIAAKSGRIINIISEAARAGEAMMAVYSGAKGAIASFGRALAREHGRDRITVNMVALGAVSHEGIKDGPLHVDATPENNELLRKMLSAYPAAKGLNRLGRPEDVAPAVAFLASDHSAFITGQTLGVSGGFVMS